MATMKDCKSVQPLLSEYVDGELSEEVSWSVKLHLASCAVCSRIADDFRATARLVSSLPEPIGPSEGFEAMLARRIADQMLAPKPLTAWGKLLRWWEERTDPTTPTGRRQFIPVMATAAALVVITPVALFLTSPSVSPVPKPSPEVVTHLVADDPSLAALWKDHASFASAQTLGDPATSTGDEIVER